MLTVQCAPLLLTFSTLRHCCLLSLLPRSAPGGPTPCHHQRLRAEIIVFVALVLASGECDQWPMAPGGDCQGWHTPATSSQASARPRQVSRTAECRAIYYTQVNNQANRSHFFDDQRSKPSCHCLECYCDCCALLSFYITIINPW